MSAEGLDELARRLYGLLPEEFVDARDAAAKEARAAGDRDLAKAVKSLRRPSVAAWAVNLLARERREMLRQLLELGASMREAQSLLDADTLRDLMRQRRGLVSAVTSEAGALAAERGQRLSDSVTRQVEETLHAAMADAEAGEAVESGVLVTALSSTGLASLADALGYAAARGGGGEDPAGAGSRTGLRAQLSVVEGEDADAERREAEREARREAELKARRDAERARREAELKLARKAVDKAAKRRAKREAKVLQLEAELEELRLRVAELEHARDTAAEALTEAEEALRDAQEACEELADG